jgi:hypothetical protein
MTPRKPVVVTREHRVAACEALGIVRELHARKWAQTAQDDQSNADMRDVAQAIAEAEARAAARERALVVAWLDGVGTQYMQGDALPCDEFAGEAYHRAKGEIERGEHAKGSEGE